MKYEEDKLWNEILLNIPIRERFRLLLWDQYFNPGRFIRRCEQSLRELRGKK